MDRDEMLRVFGAFADEGLEYVLIGAAAMGVHGVMTRLGTAASYETVEAEEKEIAGVRVKVASPRALYLLKRDTVRAIDRQDATALARAFKLDQEP